MKAYGKDRRSHAIRVIRGRPCSCCIPKHGHRMDQTRAFKKRERQNAKIEINLDE